MVARNLALLIVVVMVSAGANLYDVLGVPKDADDKTIKKAYRKLGLKYHPDKYDGDKKEGETKFAEIAHAYETLSSKEKRKQYDMFGDAGTGAGGSNAHAVFEEFFKKFAGGEGGGSASFSFKMGDGGGANMEDMMGNGGYGAASGGDDSGQGGYGGGGGGGGIDLEQLIRSSAKRKKERMKAGGDAGQGGYGGGGGGGGMDPEMLQKGYGGAQGGDSGQAGYGGGGDAGQGGYGGGGGGGGGIDPEMLQKGYGGAKGGGGGGAGMEDMMGGYGGAQGGGAAHKKTAKQVEGSNVFGSNSLVLELDNGSFRQVTRKQRGQKVWAILFHDGGKSQKCQKAVKVFDKLAKPLDGLAKIAHVDCAVNAALCKSQKVAEFPSIKVLSPDKAESYTEDIGVKALNNFLISRLPETLVEVLSTQEQMEQFLHFSTSGVRGAVILFTSKDTTAPLFKALAGDFYHILNLAEVRSSNKKLGKKFGVSKFPTLVLQLNGRDPITYKGKITHKSIRAFLEDKLENTADDSEPTLDEL